MENVAELGKVLVGQVTRLVTDALYAFVQLGMILLCAVYFFSRPGCFDRLASLPLAAGA